MCLYMNAWLYVCLCGGVGFLPLAWEALLPTLRKSCWVAGADHWVHREGGPHQEQKTSPPFMVLSVSGF